MGVWIETLMLCISLSVAPSHPVWVCGLKPRARRNNSRSERSHPVWVCGLKPLGDGVDGEDSRVTPCMGVWIET